MISIVIPTYHEAAVIQETLRRAARALRSTGEEFELIVVDDASADGTAELATALGNEFPVRVLRRTGQRGLATAVVDGWKLARGDLLGVMDADLQHPPEVLASLITAFRTPGVDLVIASRRVPGGGMRDWSWIRRFISWAATQLAASVLPWTLAAVRDPMSGMFVIRAKALEGVRFAPTGYKILLEVLAKARYRKLVEVPYVFDRRGAGSSKLDARQILELIEHLARLARSTGQLDTWIRYLTMGLVGAAVNLSVLYLVAERMGWSPALAVPVAIQLALLSTFFLHHSLTFHSDQTAERSSGRILCRFLRYEKLCAPGAILNAVMTFVLAGYSNRLLLAATVGIFAESVWNFFARVPAIWQIWHLSSSRMPIKKS